MEVVRLVGRSIGLHGCGSRELDDILWLKVWRPSYSADHDGGGDVDDARGSRRSRAGGVTSYNGSASSFKLPLEITWEVDSCKRE